MSPTLPIALLTFALGLLLGLRIAGHPATPPASSTSVTPTAAIPAPRLERAASAPLTATNPPPPTSKPLEGELATIRQLLRSQRLAQAGAALEQLLEQHPWQPDALLLRVDWLARSARHQEALALLLERRSLERDAERSAAIEAMLEPLLDQAIAAARTRSDSADELKLLELATQALPNTPRYQWQLAQSQFALHHYQATQLALQPLLYDPVWGERAQALNQRSQRRIARAGDYRHRLALKRHANHRLLALQVGGTTLTLLLDTGAGISLLNPEAASRAGLRPGGKQVRLSTVGGVVEVPLTQATLTLEGLPPLSLPLAIHDSGLPEGIDGLLGMDLLRHYEFYIDQQRDLLLLDEAEAP